MKPRAFADCLFPIRRIYRTTPRAVHVQHETGAAVWIPRDCSEPVPGALRIPGWLYCRLRPWLRPPFTTA